jgi:hypothetical protein
MQHPVVFLINFQSEPSHFYTTGSQFVSRDDDHTCDRNMGLFVDDVKDLIYKVQRCSRVTLTVNLLCKSSDTLTKFYISTVSNMATVRNFLVRSDTFNASGDCTS